MRRDVVVTGGVVLGTLVALAIGAGWKKRSAPVALASPKLICAGTVRTSALLLAEKPTDDLVDRYRRAAAI
ncbi:MAG TPA: hypothetical protein VGK86_05215 [Thermoanaerobaculia bacterium]|jgi:hypothetical protein